MTYAVTYTFNAAWFGQKVEQWIADRSLRSVAEDTGISFSTLSRIRAGHAPNLSHFLTLCAAMQADPLDFAFNEDYEPEQA